jgi:hypothetical protein
MRAIMVYLQRSEERGRLFMRAFEVAQGGNAVFRCNGESIDHPPAMDAADTIRHSLADVTALRVQQQADPSLAQAVLAVKQWQSRRFAGTYADLMADPCTRVPRVFPGGAVQPGDYSERDTQFGRIAGTLQTVFPQAVVQTATDLALLHMQTERLDRAMGLAWVHLPPPPPTPPLRGRLARRGRARRARTTTGQRDEAGRPHPLHAHARPAHDAAHDAQTAQAAYWGPCSIFWKRGLTPLARWRADAARWSILSTVHEREATLMQALFDGDPVACGTQLRPP